MDLKILKRQGGTDEWNDDKIITSIIRAGATSEEAEKVADKVRNWAKEEADDGRIKSVQLRDQIIKQLKNVNLLAANTYQLYKG